MCSGIEITFDSKYELIKDKNGNIVYRFFKSKEALENTEVYYKEKLDFSKPIINGIYNQGTISITTPRVFIFKTHEKNFMQIQKYLKECIKEGCLVIPDDVEFVGVEDLYNERNIGY
jgi:hypothetical protein